MPDVEQVEDAVRKHHFLSCVPLRFDERARLVEVQDWHLWTLLESDIRRKRPAMSRPEDTDFMCSGFDTKRIQLPMVVVRCAVATMDGDIERVRAFHEIKVIDSESHFAI